MRWIATAALSLCLLLSSAAHAQLPAPTTIHNDDTCDIGQFPAATLLVPYFEVDVTEARAVDTLVSLVNTGQRPQIVSATVWTSWGYPIFTFDTFLGSYDVHSYALYDLLVTGERPQSSVNGPRGPRSRMENPNWASDGFETCRNLPGRASPSLLGEVQETLRRTPGGATARYATGYITFDVVSRCSDRMQIDPGYFSEILYDNVLTGDTILTRATPQQFAAVPMVHIRAMPEGGSAGQAFPVSFPFTFYDLYTPASARKLDRRQPLPALFASRYVSTFSELIIQTEFLIWREPRKARPPASPSRNSLMEMVETVRFDEQERRTTVVPGCVVQMRTSCPPGAAVQRTRGCG